MYVRRRNVDIAKKTYECSHLARSYPKKQLHTNNMTQPHTYTQGWPSSQQQIPTNVTYALVNHGVLQSQFRRHRRSQHARATLEHSGN